MKARLTLSYNPDDDWYGEIEATVVSGAFSGIASAWIARQSLNETFVHATRNYPLSEGNLPEISGSGPAGNLRIAIRPFNSLGDLLVQVDLSSEDWTLGDRQQSVSARFLTEYATLDGFASELEQLLQGQRDAAVLVAK